VCAASAAWGREPRASATTQPTSGAGQPGKKATDLDYWLGQAKEGDAKKAPDPRTDGVDPFGAKKGPFQREDALPGVIEMSDAALLAGGVYTTREKPFEVFVENRWRQIPFVNVLSITAEVTEERMELRWRWREMGNDEKVYTGKKYPLRRFVWKLHLIDDTYVTGAIKGQPIWVERDGARSGPYPLWEHFSGPDGATLKECTYIKRLFVSKRLMDAVIQDQGAGARGQGSVTRGPGSGVKDQVAPKGPKGK
jgi:hypothetical protein